MDLTRTHLNLQWECFSMEGELVIEDSCLSKTSFSEGHFYVGTVRS